MQKLAGIAIFVLPIIGFVGAIIAIAMIPTPTYVKGPVMRESATVVDVNYMGMRSLSTPNGTMYVPESHTTYLTCQHGKCSVSGSQAYDACEKKIGQKITIFYRVTNVQKKDDTLVPTSTDHFWRNPEEAQK